MFGLTKLFKKDEKNEIIVQEEIETIHTQVEETEEITITLTVTKGHHASPVHHWYKEVYHNGFAKVNVCTVCNRTALYEDMHKANPCPNCGGQIQERAFVGIWNRKRRKWLKREEHFEKDIKEFQAK